MLFKLLVALVVLLAGVCIARPEYKAYSFNDFEYHISSSCKGQRQTFKDAKLVCSSFGASFASLHSAEEATFLTSHLNPKKKYWLGGQTAKNSSWVWADGSTFDYSNFSHNKSAPRPNSPHENHADRLCTSLTSTGKWAASPCSHKINFVCKKAKPSETTTPSDATTTTTTTTSTTTTVLSTTVPTTTEDGVSLGPD